MENNTKEIYTIDLLHIVKVLWHRAWLIVLVGVLTAAVGFCYASYLIEPTYSSSVMLYVNNKTDNSQSISSADITASKSLVNTYAEILKNRTTMEQVIEEADVSYSYKQLSGKIKASAANNTEILKITVTTEDPYESATIANAIADVLPGRIASIIDGSSVRIVESAIPVYEKVAPSISKYTMIGGMLGVLLVAAILTIRAILDDTIYDEEYVIQTYGCPILAKIPDLTGNEGNRYSYYYKDNNTKKDTTGQS